MLGYLSFVNPVSCLKVQDPVWLMDWECVRVSQYIYTCPCVWVYSTVVDYHHGLAVCHSQNYPNPRISLSYPTILLAWGRKEKLESAAEKARIDWKAGVRENRGEGGQSERAWSPVVSNLLEYLSRPRMSLISCFARIAHASTQRTCVLLTNSECGLGGCLYGDIVANSNGTSQL